MSKILTVKETAEHLKVSVETLKWWRKSGRGPNFVRFGHRSIRYRLEDLEAWVISQQESQS